MREESQHKGEGARRGGSTRGVMFFYIWQELAPPEGRAEGGEGTRRNPTQPPPPRTQGPRSGREGEEAEEDEREGGGGGAVRREERGNRPQPRAKLTVLPPPSHG